MSGDFNNLSLRNTTSYNPDGSFVSTGYVFTVSTNGRQLWTNNLNLNNLTASTFSLNSTFNIASLSFSTMSGSSITATNVNTSTVTTSTVQSDTIHYSTLTGSTLSATSGTVSTLNTSTVQSGAIQYSTLTGSTLYATSGTISTLNTSTLLSGAIEYSTLTGSTLYATSGTISTLQTSTLLSGAIGYSTLTGSTLYAQEGTISTLNTSTIGVSTLYFSTLTGSTLSAQSGSISSLNTSTIGVSTLYFSTLIGSTFSTTTAWISSLVTSTLQSQLIGFSTLIGSSIQGNYLYTPFATISTLTVSSVIASGGFGATGPTGAAGSGGGGGISGDTAMTSRQPTTTQAIPSGVNTLVDFGTLDTAQSKGDTGLSYAAGLFTNTTASTLPVAVDYTLVLDTTGNGSSFIGINGTSNVYGLLLNDNNIFSNSFIVLLAPSATLGVYYNDNATPTIQTTSRITLTIVSAGERGPTGAAAASTQVAVLSQTPTTAQAVPAATETLLLFNTNDAAQSQGITGLSYAAGLFTNTTAGTLPLLMEWQVLLDATGGGATYLKVGSTTYASMLTDNNSFTNSFVLLLPPSQSVGVYYMDASAVNVQTASRVTATLLLAGVGPTGIPGTVGQVATLSQTPTATQVIPAAVNTLLLWGTTDATQSQGTTGLSYSSGLYTNTTAETLPLLVEYTLIFNTTGNASSYIGINGPGNAYGAMIHTTNVNSNSFSVLLTPGSTLGIYYTDNTSPTFQTTSRICLSLLVAGQQGTTGPTGIQGPVGEVTTLSQNPSATQVIPATTLTTLLWGATDATQSQGATGLTYAAGLYTNTTSSTLPVLVEYTVYLNTTTGGYSFIGVNGSTNAFGGIYNDSNWFTNSYTVLLPSGQTVGVYYTDNGGCTVQTASRIRLSVLAAGPQGATGPTGLIGTGPTGLQGQTGQTGAVGTGPTGASVWVLSGSNTFYTAGNVGVGTTSPQNTFHVHNSTADATQAPDGNSSSGQIILTNTKTGTSRYSMAIGMDQANGFGYMNASGNTATQPICLNTRGGNVGIGTTIPNGNLHVRSISTSGDVPATLSLQNSHDLYPRGISQIKSIHTGTFGFGTALALFTRDDSGSDFDPNNLIYERMRINMNGNVGIGTTNPSLPTRIDVRAAGNGTSTTNWVAGTFGSSGAKPRVVMGTYSDIAIIGAHNNDISAWASLSINPAGFVSIGSVTAPTFQLHLFSDSAAKPGTSTWTISSDARLKTNIQLADTARCYDIIKAVPLKRYTWKDEVYTLDQVKDRSKLGWIAQDVEEVFPKAVGQKRFVYNQKYEDIVKEDGSIEKKLISEDVLEDCRDLNSDQIYAVMYGAIQKLIEDNDRHLSTIQSQQERLDALLTWARAQGFSG